jgi:hypothetical protein
MSTRSTVDPASLHEETFAAPFLPTTLTQEGSR